MGGHSSIKVTIKRVLHRFYLGSLNKDVTTLVSNCLICQQCISEHVKTLGLLQPLPVPSIPWIDIALNFIEGLPNSSGKDIILVVINKYTKYGHFLPLAHPFRDSQVVK
ncbi:hypothetical protein LWI28_020195 [Acer negundo]|uniref:Integrase zinc-binding domain-containing protein n=1 Tax=Acer negundo TaxID=4023 RepID=A0AAD5IA85_ACENE|nr:hypothetical protein LWI28_020195 [Acer negundo]